MPIYQGTTQIRKIWDGTRPIQRVYVGTNLVFQAVPPPSITSFSVNPNNIDLGTRPSGDVTFSFVVVGTAGEETDAQIVSEPQAVNIGPRYVGANGSGVTQSFNHTQPLSDQVYRLVAQNDEGASHRDVSVTVNWRPVITAFRRTGFAQAPGTQAGTFAFAAQIDGTPQPALTYRFGNGSQGSIRSAHLTSAGVNSWNLSWTIYHPSTTDSLTITATSRAGTRSSTISNIGS